MRSSNTATDGRRTAIFYITDEGLALARKLKGLLRDAEVFKFDRELVISRWREFNSFVFIMAVGIVVRTIADLIEDKRSDPAVVVLDEKGKFAISLLGGHIGGANELAREIAHFLGGEAVITTASDLRGVPSLDLWAKRNGFVIENWEALPSISTKLINTGAVKVYSEVQVDLPENFLRVDDPESADLLITNKERVVATGAGDRIYLRPRNLVVGIGCNRGVDVEEIEEAVRKVLKENNLAFSSIRAVASIKSKADEPGLVGFARRHGFELKLFTPEELNTVEWVRGSRIVFKATGARAVAEPAAILASGARSLLVPKRKVGNVTVAVSETDSVVRKPKIYIVGIGPGGIDHITPRAFRAIREADVVIGYKTYLELIKELIIDKEVLSFDMTQEIERCWKALEIASEGKAVALISDGDPGIYGMAGAMFEVLKENGIAVHIEVIPGIPAFTACAAKLGAPIAQDFAVISLSDRLTPWETIQRRLEAAASGDFVIVLYNPKSESRSEHIRKARELILKYRSPKTPVGIVRAVTREGESVIVTDLGNMLDYEIDMRTTVIVGNSRTLLFNNQIVTPRGYGDKYGAEIGKGRRS